MSIAISGSSAAANAASQVNLMMEMTMKTQPAVVVQQSTHTNGLDVQAAFDTIDAIKADARLARFQFRARNVWIDGGVNR